MGRFLRLLILGYFVGAGTAFGEEPVSPKDGPAQNAGMAEQPVAAKAANPDSPKSEEAKLLDTVRAALERNAQEIKALKEQYARDMEEQRKKVDAQQAQIQAFQRNAQVLEE